LNDIISTALTDISVDSKSVVCSATPLQCSWQLHFTSGLFKNKNASQSLNSFIFQNRISKQNIFANYLAFHY